MKSPIMVSNKICIQNKYIRNDKELLEILKLILDKRKNKKRNNSHSNIIKKHQFLFYIHLLLFSLLVF